MANWVVDEYHDAMKTINLKKLSDEIKLLRKLSKLPKKELNQKLSITQVRLGDMIRKGEYGKDHYCDLLLSSYEEVLPGFYMYPEMEALDEKYSRKEEEVYRLLTML